MSQTLLTPTVIAKESAMKIVDTGVMSRHVHTQYKNEFAKVGSTITIRKPNRFRAIKQMSINITDVVEPSTTIVLDSNPTHTAWKFSSVEITTIIDDYSKRYIAPGASSLTTNIDVDLCALYKDVYNSVGTPGTIPGTFKVLGDAQALLTSERVPSEDRVCMVNADANWALADGLKGTFAQNVAKDIITKGYLGTIANLSIYEEQNVARHLTGHFTAGATPLMNGATLTEATTIVTNGWSGANTVKKGDVFTIAAVYAVDPLSGVSTGRLRQFVVTADTADSGADMTIPISPAIISSGAYQTVDALPLTTAALTFMGSQDTYYAQNLVYHPNAFALVTVPIEMPSGVWGSRFSDADSGISCRVVKQYSIDTNYESIRLDVLAGKKTLDPAFAVRLWS